MLGSMIIFGGLIYGGMKASEYSDFTVQKQNFDDCYDYSSGNTIQVNCDQKEQEKYSYFMISLAIIGLGVFIIIKGIRRNWDQSVKNDEMLGPKRK
jgi:hypothetical protein